MAKKRHGNKDYLKPQNKKKMEIDCSMEDQITIEEMFARFPKLSIKVHILIHTSIQSNNLLEQKDLKVRQPSK